MRPAARFGVRVAEVYATLPGMPAPRRAGGDQAILFIGNARERFSLAGLDGQEYLRMLEATGNGGPSRPRHL